MDYRETNKPCRNCQHQMANADFESDLDQLFASQQIKIMKDPKSYMAYVIGRVTIITLFMMPVVALMLMTLYWRRKYYFVEHFIFSMHYHSFGFILLGILMFALAIFPSIIFTVCLVMAGAIYLFMAMKQVYQQNVWKTILKYTILNTLYLTFLSFFITLLFLASLLLF